VTLKSVFLYFSWRCLAFFSGKEEYLHVHFQCFLSCRWFVLLDLLLCGEHSSSPFPPGYQWLSPLFVGLFGGFAAARAFLLSTLFFPVRGISTGVPSPPDLRITSTLDPLIANTPLRPPSKFPCFCTPLFSFPGGGRTTSLITFVLPLQWPHVVQRFPDVLADLPLSIFVASLNMFQTRNPFFPPWL